MKASTARRLAHGCWLAMALLWVSALVIILIDGPSEIALIVVLGLPGAIYAMVGGLVARRRPENPIGDGS